MSNKKQKHSTFSDLEYLTNKVSNLMLEKKINNFIEIGPGKVLSGLVKRIDKEVLTNSINSEEDIKKIVLDKLQEFGTLRISEH